MQRPLILRFQALPPSFALEREVLRNVARLESTCDRITSCRVTLGAPRRRKHGGLSRVSVLVSVPTREISVSIDHPLGHEPEGALAAIRRAFRAVRRELLGQRRRRRESVRPHALIPTSIRARGTRP